MELEDIKGYFNEPNMMMVGGAVGGVVLGTYVGNWIAGSIGTNKLQKSLAVLIGGLLTGAVIYSIGRNMEPDSTMKPAVYGLAIGAAIPGIMATIRAALETNQTTSQAAALFTHGIMNIENAGGYGGEIIIE